MLITFPLWCRVSVFNNMLLLWKTFFWDFSWYFWGCKISLCLKDTPMLPGPVAPVESQVLLLSHIYLDFKPDLWKSLRGKETFSCNHVQTCKQSLYFLFFIWLNSTLQCCWVPLVCLFLLLHHCLTVHVPLHERFMSVRPCTHLDLDTLACAWVCVSLTSLMHGSVCSCPSHPLMAAHLYRSNTSIEIDSSDGMISDPSTKDSSSSEEESQSSDDDDGDDSDWGGGDGRGWLPPETPCQRTVTLFNNRSKADITTGCIYKGSLEQIFECD